jgi:hypothetical protein
MTKTPTRARTGKPSEARATFARPWEPTLVTSDPCALVRFAHDVIQLTDRELAELTGAHEVSVRRWRAPNATTVPRCTEQLDDLRAIIGVLLNSRLLYYDEVGRFLRSRNPDLGYRRPLALLAQGDREFQRVLKAAENLLEELDERLTPASSDALGSGVETQPLPRGMTVVTQDHERLDPDRRAALGRGGCPSGDGRSG